MKIILSGASTSSSIRRIEAFGNSQIAERESVLPGALIEFAIQLIGIVKNSRIAERELELPSSFTESMNRRVGIVGNSRIAEWKSVLPSALIESATRWIGIRESRTKNSNCLSPFIESALSLNRRFEIFGNSRIAERESVLPGALIESVIRLIGIVGNSRIAERESVLPNALIESATRWIGIRESRTKNSNCLSPFIESMNRRVGIVGNSRIAEWKSILPSALIESATRWIGVRESRTKNSNCLALSLNQWIGGLELSEIRLSPGENQYCRDLWDKTRRIENKMGIRDNRCENTEASFGKNSAGCSVEDRAAV